ncbi:MAG: SAM-dependent methyltransferase [Myxococcota bacterium]
MVENYSADTEGARACIESASDLVLRAAAELPSDVPIRLVDYGAADGGTARPLWQSVLTRLRETRAQQPVELLANDLPFNDFNALGQTLQALADGDPSMRVMMSPRSFYDAVASEQTVHLGFSATAMHWLRQLPFHIEGHTHANAVEDAAVRARFANASMRDWTAVLEHRARELRPGGSLVTVNLARDEAGLYLGHNGRDENMHEVLRGLWYGLADEGAITAEEREQATFQNFYKSQEEFTAPLRAGTSVHALGLRLVEMRTVTVGCPYRRAFEVNGDVAAFAGGLMRTVRSWSRHTFTTALQARRAEDAAERVDELYRRFEQAITAAPDRFSMDYVHNHAWMRREATP